MDQSAMDAELEYDEGKSATVYIDTKGHPTIGVGWNLDAQPLPAGMEPPLSEEQIRTLLNMSTSETITDLDAFLPWWRDLDEVRQRAMLNLCFNLGWPKFSAFTGFQGFMQAGDYQAAANDLHGTPWYSEVGERGPRIVAMIANGVSPYPASIYA